MSEIGVGVGRESDVCLADIAELDAERARIEARIAERMLEHADAVRREAEAGHEDPRVRQLQASAAADELAIALKVPVRTVQCRLASMRRVRSLLPNTWMLHRAGRLDAYKVSVIAEALNKLRRPDNVLELDDRVGMYAADHTVTQTKAWLRRFIARREPEGAKERHRHSHADRGAYISHDDDGISWLHTQLTTTDGVRIDALATRLAEPRADNDPGLTLEQARADVIADLLLGRIHIDGVPTGRTHAGATVAVVVPVTTIAGFDDAPGTSIDGQYALPADLVRDLVGHRDTIIQRILADPLGRILDVTEIRHDPSPRLRRAVQTRDATCQFPTCTRPAVDCDLDHERPWPGGPTRGDNLGPRCRRHHRLKSNGIHVRGIREPVKVLEPAVHDTTIEYVPRRM